MFDYKNITTLTESEKSIYEFILANKEKVTYMRVRELAIASHTSPATVLRFTQKLGYESFTEFKLELKKSLQAEAPTQLMESKEVIESFFTRALTDDYEERLDEVARLIGEADMVVFFGIGSSGILAEYALRLFSNFGKQSMAVDDPFYPFQQFQTILDNTVVIIFSISGETEEVIKQAQVLRELDTTVVTVTNNGQNTLTKLGDISLTYHIVPETLKTHINVTSQLPVLYIIETLAKKYHHWKNES